MTTQQQAETSVLAHKTLQFEWVVQETATLLEKAKLRQSHSVTSEPCEGWTLSADISQDKPHVDIFVTASGLKSETRVDVEFKAHPEHDKDVCFAKAVMKQVTLDPKTPDRGISPFLRDAALRRVGKRKLFITCKITRGETPAAPTPDRSDFFNKFEFSDVAVVAADARPPVFVQSFMLRRSEHFKTILDSEFSESNSTARLSPSQSVAPDERFSGDIDEFAAFSVPYLPSQDEQPRQDSTASEKDDAPEKHAKQDQLASPPDSVRGNSVGAEEQKLLRDFRLVKVPDCSYATLVTYLAYLYSSKLDFLPSPAFFLAEEKDPGSLIKCDFTKWANSQARNRRNPALPHAMYRLADCYIEPTIKARAKGWILQNITVDTAPFELFSQLSRDYPQFQADVVDFVLANLDDVIATPGWKRVVALLDEGKIPGGGSIMHKILSGSRKGRTEACYAIISVANCE